MSKLQKYATKSSVMDVYIELGDEIFRFNLTDEIKISEEGIDNEIKNQANSYALLSMLHKKLIKAARDAEMEAKRVRAQQYLNWKQDINPDTNRPYPDEQCSSYAEVSEKYQAALRRWTDVQEKCNVLETCVRAFEMRNDLLRTLSANIRKTN